MRITNSSFGLERLTPVKGHQIKFSSSTETSLTGKPTAPTTTSQGISPETRAVIKDAERLLKALGEGPENALPVHEVRKKLKWDMETFAAAKNFLLTQRLIEEVHRIQSIRIGGLLAQMSSRANSGRADLIQPYYFRTGSKISYSAMLDSYYRYLQAQKTL